MRSPFWSQAAQSAWDPRGTGEQSTVYTPHPTVRRLFQREGEHQLDESLLQEGQVRRPREPGNVTPEEAPQRGIDGGRGTSPPEHVSLLPKRPTIYGSVLLLAGPPPFHRCAAAGLLQLPSCPHEGAVLRAAPGNRTAGADTPLCSPTCFLSGLWRSLLQRGRIPSCPQPHPHLSPNSLVLAKLTSVKWLFITILISLIASVGVLYIFLVLILSHLSTKNLYLFEAWLYFFFK